MAIIYDAHRHIVTNLHHEVERFEDGEALSERIREWLETPEGTLADLPHWGNNLLGFKHDPQGQNLEVGIEMAIARKMAKDIDDLVILGVGVEYLGIDFFQVIIRHQLGGTVEVLRL